MIYYRFVARMMQEAQYPVDYGSFENLSEQAEKIIDYNDLSYYHRLYLDGKEPWRTFRDYYDGEKFKSIFTGRPSVSLKQKWLDIDDAARGLLMAVLQAQPDNWDICGASPVSFGELLTLIGDLTGKGVEIAASECVVADADCLVAEPTNVAPFMAHDVGSLQNLKNRLLNYAQMLSKT